MKFLSSASLFCSALSLLSANFLPSVDAFTNGTLLPAYLCGPKGDGEPKSLGSVLPYFVLNTFPGSNVADIPVTANAVASVTNTQFLLAGFHNGAFSITPSEHEMTVTIQANGMDNGMPLLPNVVYPGRDHVLTLTSSPALVNGVPFPDVNIALDGALVYAVDSTGQRVGSFTNVGAQMAVFPGCGPLSAGVVHTNLLAGTPANPLNFYTGLVWHAPATLTPGQFVTFKGAAVSDGILVNGNMTQGFGAHATTYPIRQQQTLNPVAPSITKVLLTANMAGIFFVDENLGSNVAGTQAYQIWYGIANAAANPLTTIGPNTLPLGAGTAAVALNVTYTLTATVTVAANGFSPIFIDIKGLIASSPSATALAGGLVAVQVAAITLQGTSPMSNQVSFAVGAANPGLTQGAEVYFARNYVTPFYPPANAKTITVTPLTGAPTAGVDLLALSYPIKALCDSNLQDQLKFYVMTWALDLDKGCGYLNTLLAAQPPTITAMSTKTTLLAAIFNQLSSVIGYLF